MAAPGRIRRVQRPRPKIRAAPEQRPDIPPARDALRRELSFANDLESCAGITPVARHWLREPESPVRWPEPPACEPRSIQSSGPSAPGRSGDGAAVLVMVRPSRILGVGYHLETHVRNSLLNSRGTSFAMLDCIGVHYNQPEPRLDGEWPIRARESWLQNDRSASRSLMARHYAIRERT